MSEDTKNEMINEVDKESDKESNKVTNKVTDKKSVGKSDKRKRAEDRKGTKFDQLGPKKVQNLINTSFSYKDVILKSGYKTSGGKLTEMLKDYIASHDLDASTLEEEFYRHGHKFTAEEVLRVDTKASHKTVSRFYKRTNKAEYQCAICGNDGKWQGDNLSLALTYINGNKKDASPQNLRWLCPNCLSQQKNFGVTKRKDDDGSN